MSTNGSTNTTTPGLRDVDAAVRSVLADLLAASRPVASRPGGSDVFAGRLLSLREVEAFRGGMREVRLAPRTVVTPLAREALKRRGIDIRFVSRSEVERASNVGEWGFAIETLEYSSVVEVFRRSLLDEASEWRDLGASADEAASWVAQAS